MAKYKIVGLPKKKYQGGGIVELDGYRFKKDTNGNWIYESGAPVTDRGMIQRLTYEAKPVDSSPAAAPSPYSKPDIRTGSMKVTSSSKAAPTRQNAAALQEAKLQKQAEDRAALLQKQREAEEKRKLEEERALALANPNKALSETLSNVAAKVTPQTEDQWKNFEAAKKEYNDKRDFLGDVHLNENYDNVVYELARDIQRNNPKLSFEEALTKAKEDNQKLKQKAINLYVTQDPDVLDKVSRERGFYSPQKAGNTVIKSFNPNDPRYVSFDNPGTVQGYLNQAGDVILNPLDAFHYFISDTEEMPFNYRAYEEMKQRTGYEDASDNNSVLNTIDAASWFLPAGAAAQGLKMIPGTVDNIGLAIENPSWENIGNAAGNVGLNALALAPGFGLAKNFSRGASSIDDLRAIEALRGNTTTTPFQSYYLQGNRALGASEAALPQAQALRRFTGQQPLELPAGKPQFFNSEYSELYDDLQRQIDNQKSVSNEIANFNPIDKINKPKVDSETFKRLIMGDDLKFKFDDYPDTPRITGQFQGLEIGRPGTLNAVGETPIPKPSFRPPRGTAQQKALSDLEKLRQQTITGQDEALLRFEELQKQKLKDLKTPEGRRRIQEFIDDNDIKGEYDKGNVTQLKDEYVAELPKIVENKDTNKINDIIKNVKKHYANKGALRAQRNAKNSGLQSWDELTAADIERAANPSSINDVILKENITTALAEVDPRNTSGFKKFSVDDYIEHIEQTAYDTKGAEILDYELGINKQKSILQNKINELNRLRRETNNGADLSSDSYKKQYDSIVRALRNDIKVSETLIKNYESSLKSAQNYLNRRNANADIPNNEINLGNPFTAIGDLEPTIYHEFGHITEGSFLPMNSNSAIDKDLISELDFLDEAPEYLFQQLDSDKILSETFPYNISKQGTSKYQNPEGYFKEAKEYFLKGGNDMGESMEPSAFAVELRPALKRLGLIKNDFDKVTPEMVKELYEAYTTNPEFKFLDLRILDIIKPTERSFKTLSKNLNKIKGIVPYAIPIGAATAAGASDQGEELQQDMEYAKGGIITSLSDDEINQYIKDGYIVEEYQEGGQNNLNEYFTIPSNISEIEMYKNSLKPAPKTVQKPTPKTNRPNLNEYFTVPTNWQDLQEKETPKPVEDKKPQYSFSKNYPFINKEYIDEILATNSKSGEKSEKEIVDQYSFSKDYPFINKEYIDEIIKQLPKKETPKKGTKKKSVKLDQAKSMMEILSKYNVTGKTPFFSAPDLENLPKFTEGEMKSAKKDADKRFAEGKKRVKENEVKDSGVLDILGNALATSYYYTTIEAPSTSAGKLVESAYDEVQDFFQYAWNGIKRKVQTSGIIDDSDIKVKPLSVTNPLSIEDYYKNRNPIRQQVLDVPNGNGRTYKQQVIPLSNISLGYRNRGDYSKDIKTSGLELTTFHPFTSKPKNITDNTSVFAIDKSGNLHTGKYGDLKSNADWKFSQTYMNKIKDIRSDFQDGSKSGNSGYWQPKITVIEDGKEKVGSLNLLTKGKGKEDFYGSIQGGRVLFVNPNTKEQFLVSGSLNHIKSEFKRLKGDAPYLEAWTLDNGTYSRGLSYKDGVLTKDRLKSYDLENGSGGNGLYIMNYNAPIHRYEEEYIKGMPNIRTTNSASYKAGSPLKNEVKNVVLHHTAFTDPVKNNQGVHNHFMNPKSEASAHVVIEEDGKRTVYASPEQVTFHAGKSSWNGRSNVNDFAIGVEFQGDTNIKPLTEAQIESFVEYFDDIASKYNLSLKDIITHAMVAPGRKPDITDKEYKRVLKYMKDRGYT